MIIYCIIRWNCGSCDKSIVVIIRRWITWKRSGRVWISAWPLTRKFFGHMWKVQNFRKGFTSRLEEGINTKGAVRIQYVSYYWFLIHLNGDYSDLFSLMTWPENKRRNPQVAVRLRTMTFMHDRFFLENYSTEPPFAISFSFCFGYTIWMDVIITIKQT